jgi:hypothetical protein
MSSNLWTTKCITLVDGHPGTKRLEMLKSWNFQCYHKTIWALSWLTKLWELSQTDRVWFFGNTSGLIWGIASERSCLSLHLAIWAKWASWQKRLTKSCGKSAPPLQRVKTKYLAVSPVMDNFEQHDFEDVQGSHLANFLKLKLVGWTRNMSIGASVYC